MGVKDEKRRIEIIAEGTKVNATMKEMEAAVRELNAQLRNLPKNSAEFVAKSKELAKVKGELKGIRDEVNGVAGVFGKLKEEIKAFGLIAIGTLGLDFLFDKVRDIIGQNTKLADSFSDIQKTTGMTQKEVEQLNKALGSIDTRTSASELREIAIAAGQLGIAKEDILKFTDATDKLVVSLGDEFKGGAEQVTKEMGALRNIFADVKSDNVADDMLHIGNAINQLASAGAATGPVVADFANRIGGVGINLGLTSGQVLGLSATLQELNVNTERGGTAMTKILLKMTTDTASFAKIAGIPTKEFTKLVNTDLYGAFVKVAEGSKRSGATATAFGAILDKLGVDGAGASEVFSKIGSNSKLLQEKVDLANASLQNTNGIMNEFALKNDNVAGRAEKLGKKLTSIFTSETFNSWVATAIDKTSSFIDWLIKLPETIEKNRSMLVAIGSALLAYNSKLVAGTLLTWLDIAAKKVGIETTIVTDGVVKRLTLSEIALQAKQKAGIFLTNTGNALKKAYAFTTGVLTGAITAETIATNIATAATKAWTTAIKANPILLLITLAVAAIGALVSGIMKVTEVMAENREIMRDAFANEYVRRTNVEFGKTKGLMGDINKLTMEQIALREKDIESRVKIAKAQLEFARQDKRIGAEELAAVTENYKKTLQLKTDLFKHKVDLLNKEEEARRSAANTTLVLTEEEEKKLKKKLEEALKEYEKLVEEFDDFETKSFVDRLTKNDQELHAVTAKYDGMIAAREKFLKNPLATKEQKQKVSAEIEVLNAEKAEKVTETVKKQQREFVEYVSSLEDRLTQKMGTEYDRRLLAINKFYDDANIKAKGDADIIAQNEKHRTLEIQENRIKREADTNDRIVELKRELTAKTRLQEANEFIAIGDKYDHEIELLTEQYNTEEQLQAEFLDKKNELEQLKKEEQEMYLLNKEKQIQQQLQDIQLQALNVYLNYVQQAQKQGIENELRAVKTKEDAQIAAVNAERDRLNGRVDTRTKADKKADAEIEKIQQGAAAREHELRLKQAKAEREFAVMRIAIDAAMQIAKVEGIASAFAAGVATAPLSAVALSQIGVILGIAAVQTAAVYAQPLPQMAKGGILKGPKHSSPSKGMPVMDPVTGRAQLLVEGGEAVIDSETVENNPGIINDLLQARGKSIAPGWFMNKPVFADTGRLFNSVRQMGDGGIIGSNSSPAPGGDLNINGSDLLRAAQKFEEAVDRMTSNPFYAEVSLIDIKKKIAEIRKISRGTEPTRKPDGYVKDGKVFLYDDIL